MMKSIWSRLLIHDVTHWRGSKLILKRYIRANIGREIEVAGTVSKPGPSLSYRSIGEQTASLASTGSQELWRRVSHACSAISMHVCGVVGPHTSFVVA
jgi:hypothetical protein